ncbi:MAG: alpha/beta fold hydrolase, partial [Rhodothermia bacterium]|nr:alpha/beta fold hydrolase [Rhodothermia bacterium]
RFSNVASVIAADLRNHGQSPHGERMDYEAMSRDVLEMLDDLDLASVNLLGHSMGGKVAMQLALTEPDRVERLVVVDVAPKAYENRHENIIEALKSLDLAAYDSRSEIDEALKRDIPSLPVRQFLLKNLRYSAEDGYSWLVNLAAIDQSYDEIAGPVTATGEFSGPTLFVRGGQSDYLLQSDEDDIRRLFPEARFVTVEGAGHWVHAEAPNEFADIVIEFLATQ